MRTHAAAAVLVTVLACAVAPSCARQRAAVGLGGEEELDVRDVVGDARVSLAQAVQAALTARPGLAVEAELEGEVEAGKREVEYEVAVLSEGVLYEVEVDAATGEVVEIDREDDADDLRAAVQVRDALGTGHMQLGDLVARAAGASDGTPVEAEFEDGSGAARVRVKLVRGREIVKVTLDARTGAVLGTKTK
jgi:uncharacterized membrane protein YkoI